MKLKLHTDEYVIAMGAVGILRLCRQAEQYQWTENPWNYIEYKEDHLLVDSAILEQLPEWYFKSLLIQYSVSNREQKKLQHLGTNTRYQTPNDQLKTLKDAINSNVKKLSKYFPEKEEFLQMKQCLEDVKRLKAEQVEEHLALLRDRYLNLLRTPAFEERLTFNIIRSVVLARNFFGQASFLQKTMSHFNLQQHVDKMRKDFIEPLLLDIRLHEILRQKDVSPEEKHAALLEHFAQSTSSYYRRWKREVKKLEPEQIDQYFQHEVRCTFEEEWLATDNFEEKAFVPLGVSHDKSYNFSWNLQDQPVPISSWVRLILLLAPIGVTPYTRRVDDEFETFYSFVYCDGTPKSVYEDNEDLRTLEQNESFEQLIPRIAKRDRLPKNVKREKKKAKQELKANIQIIEFNSDYDSKKTILHYYHVPRHVLNYLSSDARLEFIKDRTLRDTFLRLVLESVDPIQCIWSHLVKVVRGKADAGSAYYALSERLKIQHVKKEGASMKHHGHIKAMFNEGKTIRDKLYDRAGQQREATEYASGGDKRVAGVAYRLLNAAKAGNRKQFLDTTIRLYLQVGEPVPGLLLNVIHEEKLDFDSLSGAFITGLLFADRGSNGDNQDATQALQSGQGVNS